MKVFDVHSILSDAQFEEEKAIMDTASVNEDGLVEKKPNPSDPAYIVFTSGSTGRPKPVVLSHCAAATGMSYAKLNGRTNWLLFLNPSTSAAQRAVWATIVLGGCVCITDKETVTTSLAQTIRDFQIQAVQITPSALPLISPEEVPGLELITMAGERPEPGVVDKWVDKVELRNAYGLSECTQINFSKRMEKGSDWKCVGRPIDATTAYIVDDSMQLVPKGTVGEICLAGPQLASGYLNREEATAKVFIKNPFGEGRLYKTGDLAMETDEGYDIIGRKDYQLKIGGLKIVPEEVTAALSGCEVVQSCVVFGALMGSAKALVAAVVPKEEESEDGQSSSWRAQVQSMREYLAARLPEHIVPHYWLKRESIPYSVSNKADISSLRREAEQLGPAGLLELFNESGEDDVELTDAEEVIRDVWSEVLGIAPEQIKKHHSFTMLGGTSLQALRVISLLRDQNILLELRHLFRSENLADTAAASESFENTSRSGTEGIAPFSLIKDDSLRSDLQGRGTIEDAYPATPIQTLMLAATFRGHKGYLFQRTCDLTGVDIPKLKAAFELVFRESDILRTTISMEGGRFMQTVRTDFQLPWYEESSPVEEFLKRDLEKQIKPGSIFFRLTIVNGATLVVSAHHCLFDFWSSRFLYQDVAAVYYSMPRSPRPPFRNFVAWVDELQSPSAEAYWKEYSKDLLPTYIDVEKAPVTTRLIRAAPPSLAQSASAKGLTVASIGYTAWALVLARLTGQRSVTFGTDVASRDSPVAGVERIDGPVFALTPQIVSMKASQTIQELAATVSHNQWDLMAHAQWRTRDMLLARKPPPFNTMVNVLVSQRDEDEEDFGNRLFKSLPETGVREMSNTTLLLSEKDGETQFDLVSKLEKEKAEEILEWVGEAVGKILEEGNVKVGEYLGWTNVEVV
ncbi:acetyl-CoA synthetase-like protein, partial [Glonium stellatum]